jgi:hypothetical protein
MPTDPDDALFLALAQPLLRAPDGGTWVVVPAGGRGIAARPLTSQQPNHTCEACWCWGHADPQDPWPWLATPQRVLALVEGRRPLRIQPAQAWGAAGPLPDAPRPGAVHVRAGGLDLVFVNAGSSTRVFAADEQQAVECAALPDSQVCAAWTDGLAVWAAGLRPRRTAADEPEDFGHALVLRFDLRPLALAGRWAGREACRVAPALQDAPAAAWSELAGIEAWVASLPADRESNESAAPVMLVGAALRRLHLGDQNPLWSLGALHPGDHADLVLARPGRGPVGEDAWPTIVQWLPGHAWVTHCAHAAQQALVVTSAHGVGRLGQAQVRDLQAWHWQAAEGRLHSPQALQIDGLPPGAQQAALADLDITHHPGFGFAAMLAWWLPAMAHEAGGPVRTGVLMHSRDGRHWQVVSPAP